MLDKACNKTKDGQKKFFKKNYFFSGLVSGSDMSHLIYAHTKKMVKTL